MSTSNFAPLACLLTACLLPPIVRGAPGDQGAWAEPSAVLDAGPDPDAAREGAAPDAAAPEIGIDVLAIVADATPEVRPPADASATEVAPPPDAPAPPPDTATTACPTGTGRCHPGDACERYGIALTACGPCHAACAADERCGQRSTGVATCCRPLGPSCDLAACPAPSNCYLTGTYAYCCPASG